VYVVTNLTEGYVYLRADFRTHANTGEPFDQQCMNLYSKMFLLKKKTVCRHSWLWTACWRNWRQA